MNNKEEFNEPWLYRVYFINKQPIMSVLVGQAVQYEKKIHLTEEQYTTFKNNRALARKFAESVLLEE